MKLKQWGLKLGLALVAVGLMAAQVQAADSAAEPLNAGPTTVSAYAAGAHAFAESVEQVSALPNAALAYAPAAPAVQQVAGSGPLGVEGSAALAAFSQADIATLFEPSAAPLQLAALSEQEMRETEGAVAPIMVYGLMVGSRVLYVGITNNLARRTAEHKARFAFTRVREFGVSATRSGARVMEQNNINRFNTINNGWSRINAISPRSPLARQVSVPFRSRR